MFIDFLLNRDGLKSRKEPSASLAADAYGQYCEQNIGSLLAPGEANRLETLKQLQQRSWIAIAISSMAVVLAIFAKVGPLLPYYEALAHLGHHIGLSYTLWYRSLPTLVSFFLPEHVTYWAFPSPFTLCVIIILVALLWALRPLLRYGKAWREQLWLPVWQFFSPFVGVGEGMRAASFYESGILPLYNGYASEPRLKATTETGLLIEVAAIKLFLTTEERLFLGWDISDRKVVFNGVFVALYKEEKRHATEEALPLFHGQTIIVAHAGKKRHRKEYNHLPRVTQSEHAASTEEYAIYSDRPDEAAALASVELCKELTALSAMIHSRYTDVKQLDEKYTQWQNRKNTPEIAPIYRNQIIASSIQCSFFKGRVLLTIPTVPELFTVTSLFVPLTYTSDLLYIRQIMRCIASATKVMEKIQK